MKILLDHNLDWRLARALPNHEVKSTIQMKWGALQNGELLSCAEKENFSVMLTADTNIKAQQKIEGRSIALIVLRAPNSKLKTHLMMIPAIEHALLALHHGEVVELFHPEMKPYSGFHLRATRYGTGSGSDRV
ncbi:MAG: DUF5615 family PIN-like protein [Blastocatellia bacterium]